MQRWLEEFEIKHIEFMRAIKSFSTMHDIWKSLASSTTHAGSASFARRQSYLYLDLCESMRRWFKDTAEPRFLNITEDNIIDTIQKFRADELDWLMKYGHSTSE